MKRKILLFLAALFCAHTLTAGVFTSSDGRFTMDMPSGWASAASKDKNNVLSLKKAAAQLDIATFEDCKTETCLEKKINEDLAAVKAQKMKVIGNTYTGEEIKRIDFSTGEPFFYISYFSPKADFSSGYFLVGQKAYSIKAQKLSYAETDLIFSFIYPIEQEEKPAPAKTSSAKPVEQPLTLNMDLKDPRAYDIAAAPQVQEENLLEEAPAAQEEAVSSAVTAASVKEMLHKYGQALKNRLPKLNTGTLVTKDMPPFIRRAGHLLDVIALLFALYILTLVLGLIIKIIRPARKNEQKVNPNSLYPIKFKRLYGTPSLIFRARDNQGNTLTSLSSRWDCVFLFTGSAAVVLALGAMAVAGVLQTLDLFAISSFAYSTIYSGASLVLPLGVLVFFCGVIWSQLMLREITLYDRRGQKAVFILQKGFGLTKERYEIYFAKSKDVVVLERKRFSYYRRWNMATRDGNVLAVITENNRFKAVLRKFTGHLWGLLRASYHIEGPMDSKGNITNACQAFNRFTCNIDKPQAIAARDMLAAALVINIRDKDKWYPWFN